MFAILTALSGCAAHFQVTRAAGDKLRARELEAPVEVMNRGTLPQQPFLILGKVFLEKSYSG